MITIENKPIYQGKSTDNKPTDVEVNSKFEERDTGDEYFFDGTTWAKIGG